MTGEVLLEFKIEIPKIESLEKFDNFLLLFGGIILGIIIIKFGGNFNRYAGIFIISVNVIVGGYLLLQAIN